MATSAVGRGSAEHVGSRGVDQAEDAREVDIQRAAELRGGHGGDRGFVRRPDAVVGYQDVEIAERRKGGSYQGFALVGRGEFLLDRKAERRTTALSGERIGFIGGLMIAERNAGASFPEQSNGGGADPTRSSGDEGSATGEREGDSSARISRRGWVLHTASVAEIR